MDEVTKMTMLTMALDMRNPPDARKAQLQDLLTVAASRLTDMGITLDESLSDAQLQVDYAAWMYRRKMLVNGPAMPRYLQVDIHDRLIRQKGGGAP